MGSVKKIPLRKCIGCGEMKNKKEMMRVIRTPENQVTLDVTGKKNGRGAYLCFSRDCLAKAMNRGLERSLKIAVGQDVFESLERELDAIESKS